MLSQYTTDAPQRHKYRDQRSKETNSSQNVLKNHLNYTLINLGRVITSSKF